MRWPRASGASAGSPSRTRSRLASAAARAGIARRPARAGHGRRDPRAARQRPLPRQPLLGTHGRRARRGGAPARRRGDPARGEPGCRRAARRRDDPDADRRVDVRRRARARRTSTCCCSRPRSPTTARPSALAGKRAEGRRAWTLELAPTDRHRAALGEQKRPGQVLVAFGAEHGEDGLERKRAMLETKNADLVVFNDVGRADIGFDSAENEVVLITREGERTVPKASKSAIAAAILDAVEEAARGREVSDAYDVLPRRPAAARSRPDGAGDGAAREGEAARAARRRRSARRSGSPTSGSRRWRTPSGSSAPSSRSSPDRRLRALRARPGARAAGPDGRGERALQARELDEARPPSTTRARSWTSSETSEGGRPARLAGARRRPAARSAPGLCVLLGVADGDDEARPRGSPRRSPACGSSRTPTASSTARSSTRAARRSSCRQFTLIADTAKGNRPRSRTPRGPRSRSLCTSASAQRFAALGVEVQKGVFGAQMQVELVNDGPVTIVVEAN